MFGFINFRFNRFDLHNINQIKCVLEKFFAKMQEITVAHDETLSIKNQLILAATLINVYNRHIRLRTRRNHIQTIYRLTLNKGRAIERHDRCHSGFSIHFHGVVGVAIIIRTFVIPKVFTDCETHLRAGYFEY